MHPVSQSSRIRKKICQFKKKIKMHTQSFSGNLIQHPDLWEKVIEKNPNTLVIGGWLNGTFLCVFDSLGPWV